MGDQLLWGLANVNLNSTSLLPRDLSSSAAEWRATVCSLALQPSSSVVQPQLSVQITASLCNAKMSVHMLKSYMKKDSSHIDAVTTIWYTSEYE